MRVVLASGNQHKIDEIARILPSSWALTPQSAFDVSPADETGLTFVENAILKARHAARETGLAAIADDSGLEVDALDGAPGIYSARYAGPDASDTDNNAKLLKDLADSDEENRTARFRCVIVLLRHESDPMPLIASGTLEGSILFEPRGIQGFGYDPLFYLPDRRLAVAELAGPEKDAISHRGQALRQFRQLIEP